MAKRYSGRATIHVEYKDNHGYKCSISIGGKNMWSGVVMPAAAAGFGPGVAYDSSQAYDEIAQSAVSFALNEGNDSFPTATGASYQRLAGQFDWNDNSVFVSRSKYYDAEPWVEPTNIVPADEQRALYGARVSARKSRARYDIFGR